jgi:hypothetical protein
MCGIFGLVSSCENIHIILLPKRPMSIDALVGLPLWLREYGKHPMDAAILKPLMQIIQIHSLTDASRMSSEYNGGISKWQRNGGIRPS